METSSISVLPEEILQEVFEFLSTHDRRRARLVCKSWFQILSRSYFTRKEAFFFPEFYDFPTIAKEVHECRRDELNLKFKNRRFPQNSIILWEKCGHKIVALEFEECTFHPDVLFQIFEHCIKLKEIFAKSCKICSHRNRRLFQASFSRFGNNHFVRENLVTLDMAYLPHSISDLTYIASVFPKLKTLRISLKNNVVDTYLSTLQNLLHTQKLDIETLVICIRGHCNYPDSMYSVQKFISSNRTVKVTMSGRLEAEKFAINNIPWNPSFEFLTALDISGEVDGGIPIPVTLLAGVVEVPTLQRLKCSLDLTMIEVFCMNWSVLVKSRVVYLEIVVRSLSPVSEMVRRSVHLIDSFLDGLPRNNTVRNLRVSDCQGAEFGFLFCKYFVGVWDLIIGAEPTTIFQYQTQLRSIRLDIQLCWNQISPQTSIASVEIVSINHHVVRFFSLYRFPNLKYLRVAFRRYFYKFIIAPGEAHFPGRTIQDRLHDDLQELTSILRLESPKLKGVNINFDCDGMETFEFIFRFCRHFPNLRYIQLEIESLELPRKSDLMREIMNNFNHGSSVKKVWITTPYFRICYFFNAVKGAYEFSKIYNQSVLELPPICINFWEEDYLYQI